MTCFIHVRRNITQKLQECNVSSEASRKILNDIFGHPLEGLQEGLVDADNAEDFQVKLEMLCKTWKSFTSTSSSDMDGFISWFLKNKRNVICDTMLCSIREDCGLGNPPSVFTTNASESMNAILKHKVDHKKSDLSTFIQKVKELTSEQMKEIERAVIDRGKYKFNK